jgi:hypothetical protein
MRISKTTDMKKEKWLNALFFETGLFEMAGLQDEEDRVIRKYLQDSKTPKHIAKEYALPVDEVKNLIRTGFKKLLITSKEVIATKTWFRELISEKEALKAELATLRERFKKELADTELTATYHWLKIPVTNFPFSTRAQSIFLSLKINTLNDLAALSLDDLKMTRNAGPKTVDEIVTKALELGITLI